MQKFGHIVACLTSGYNKPIPPSGAAVAAHQGAQTAGLSADSAGELLPQLGGSMGQGGVLSEGVVDFAATDSLMAGTESQAEIIGEMFGPQAHMASAQALAETLTSNPLMENWVMKVLALVLFVAWVVVLLVYGNHVGGMWKIVLGRNIGIKIADELSYLFIRASLTFAVLGVVAVSVASVRVLAMAGVESIEGVNSLAAAPVLVVSMVAVLMLAWILTRAMCSLVRRVEVARGLDVITIALLGLMATVATPCAVLFVINDGASAIFVGAAIALVVAVTALTFVIKSFVFFVEQKISILLWFLYLCAVVLIPLGVVATIIVRNSAF